MGLKSKKVAKPKQRDERISLAPLDFVTAIRAAMQTGKPPKAAKKTKKRKAKG